jgi:hypothetical protein
MADRGLAALEKALTEAHDRWNDVCEGPNGWLPFGPFAAVAVLGEKGVFAADGSWFDRGVERIVESERDLQATFDLRWKADMRAIKRWQAAHPGKENIWPDHADMVVWLLGEVERLEQGLKIMQENFPKTIPAPMDRP